MESDLKASVDGLMGACIEANAPEGSYPFLPDIVEVLRQMERDLHSSRERRERLAAGLGRLVTEDWAFSESALGGALLQLADDFASE